MKAHIYAILLVGLVLTSCIHYDDSVVGPRGPVGPQGPAGAPGENGYLFEYTNVNFTAPDFEVVLPYPADFDGLSSDVALVYLLWDVQEVDGSPLEIWRPLPQTLLTQDGLLQYNYDHSLFDVRLFLDAEFPLSWLTANDTDEWIVRVVVVPAEFWNGRIDTDYESISRLLSLPELPPRLSKVRVRN